MHPRWIEGERDLLAYQDIHGSRCRDGCVRMDGWMDGWDGWMQRRRRRRRGWGEEEEEEEYKSTTFIFYIFFSLSPFLLGLCLALFPLPNSVIYPSPSLALTQPSIALLSSPSIHSPCFLSSSPRSPLSSMLSSIAPLYSHLSQ